MPKLLPLTATDVDLAYESAQKVVQTHRRLVEFLRPGLTLAAIDAFIARTLAELKCRSCFLDYRLKKGRLPPFPSHACLSVNDCVVHGTAGTMLRPLQDGDVLKIDVGVTSRGWVGDAAWTYFVGGMDDVRRRLAASGKESLRRGVEELRPGNTYLAWARAVQGHVEEECGFHLIRGLGGHGYGRQLHAEPFVSNVIPDSSWEWPEGSWPCRPGTLLAVEPMIAVGTGEVRQAKGQWPVYTADGSLSVHYEHDVFISETGPRVLTEGLEDMPDVVGG